MDLFQYKDYKRYLNDRLDNQAVSRGARSLFAKTIGSQSAYISSVLRGTTHFTPEQGEAINAYFHHSELESEYFLLLLQHQRAGTALLKQRFQKNIDRILESRLELKNRLDVAPVLTVENQNVYYSEWYFAAIHVLTSIPEFQTVEHIAEHLKLPASVTRSTLEFLVDTGLVLQTKTGFKIGATRIHLGSDSPFISRHHSNWRLLTAQKLYERKSHDTHYSSVVTLSEKDAHAIREQIVEFIQTTKEQIKNSKEEQLYSFNLDFFSL